MARLKETAEILQRLSQEIRYDANTGFLWWRRQNVQGNRDVAKPIGSKTRGHLQFSF